MGTFGEINDANKFLPRWSKGVGLGILSLIFFWAFIYYHYSAALMRLTDAKFVIMLVAPSMAWYAMSLIRTALIWELMVEVALMLSAKHLGADIAAIKLKKAMFWAGAIIEGISSLIIFPIVASMVSDSLTIFMATVFLLYAVYLAYSGWLFMKYMRHMNRVRAAALAGGKPVPILTITEPEAF